MAPTSSNTNLSKRSFCPDTFPTYISQIYLGYYIAFLVIFVSIFIASFFVRKRSGGAGKSLIGFVYILTLLLAITSLAVDFASILRAQCQTGGFEEIRDMSLASNFIGFISIWGMLVLVVYQVNILLRKQLGSAVGMFRLVCLAAVGVTGILLLAYLCISSYVWVSTSKRMWNEGHYTLRMSSRRLSMAVRALYVLCVILSAALAMMTLSGLRRAQSAAGDLIGWVAVLHIFMFIWSGLSIVTQALNLYTEDLSLTTSIALSYVMTVFQALSFVALLGIAKHTCWKQGRKPAQHVYAPVMQGRAAYVH